MDNTVKPVNNKEEIPLSYYSEKFASLDVEQTSKRTNTLYDTEKQAFRIKLMGEEYLVSYPVLEVKKANDEAEVKNSIKILLARYLISGLFNESNGEFITYRDIPWGETYYTQFTGRCITRLAYSYSSKLEKFASAMESIGAKKTSSGDCGYTFEFINGIYISFILWAADEEFPPSAQILFSPNFPLAFTAEDAAVACETAIGWLKGKTA